MRDCNNMSRDMASVSRNLGRLRMMVFANTDAHTYSIKKKIFIYRHTYVHSRSMRHVAYGNIEGYNVHAYSHMDSISYTVPA
jgi:hypothetical protein